MKEMKEETLLLTTQNTKDGKKLLKTITCKRNR